MSSDTPRLCTVQVTIPSQRTSPLFVRNVREFAGVSSGRSASGEPFAFS
jgi:hypothetical protein